MNCNLEELPEAFSKVRLTPSQVRMLFESNAEVAFLVNLQGQIHDFRVGDEHSVMSNSCVPLSQRYQTVHVHSHPALFETDEDVDAPSGADVLTSFDACPQEGYYETAMFATLLPNPAAKTCKVFAYCTVKSLRLADFAHKYPGAVSGYFQILKLLYMDGWMDFDQISEFYTKVQPYTLASFLRENVEPRVNLEKYVFGPNNTAMGTREFFKLAHYLVFPDTMPGFPVVEFNWKVTE